MSSVRATDRWDGIWGYSGIRTSAIFIIPGGVVGDEPASVNEAPSRQPMTPRPSIRTVSILGRKDSIVEVSSEPGAGNIFSLESKVVWSTGFRGAVPGVEPGVAEDWA